jgi:hypothetical protein
VTVPVPVNVNVRVPELGMLRWRAQVLKFFVLLRRNANLSF